MKRYFQAAGLAVLIMLGLSPAALAAPGYATDNVNLRAGPSTSYPAVTTIAAGSSVNIHGCLSGYSWCDVTWRHNRGWVSSHFLQARYQSRRVRVVEAAPPIISFNFSTYWSNNYRHRSFYRDRTRWEHFSVSSHHRDRSEVRHRRHDHHAARTHHRHAHRAAASHHRNHHRAAVKHRRHEHRADMRGHRQDNRAAAKVRHEHRAAVHHRNRRNHSAHSQRHGEHRAVNRHHNRSAHKSSRCTLDNACH